jgi:hypothetical protein
MMARRRNPPGYAWDADTPLYHGTASVRAIQRTGFLPRRLIAGRPHRGGGGPDESVSFSIDWRVSMTFCLGFIFAQRAARRMVDLPEFLEQQRAISEKQFREAYIGHGLGVRLDDLKNLKNLAVMADAVTDYEYQKREYYSPGELWFEQYKKFGFFANWNHEAFDPLFMHTRIKELARTDPRDIGVLRCFADLGWLCTESPEFLGLDPQGLQTWGHSIGGWVNQCEYVLRGKGYGAEKTFEKDYKPWQLPHPSDTGVHLLSLQEIRVYDPKLIHTCDLMLTGNDCLKIAKEAWTERGVHFPGDAYYYPWFPMEKVSR